MSELLESAITAISASKHASYHWLTAKDEFVKDEYCGDVLILTEMPDGTFRKFILAHDADIDDFFDYYILPMTHQDGEIPIRKSKR